jgi:hypothetical protein
MFGESVMGKFNVVLVLCLLAQVSVAYNSSIIDTSKPVDSKDIPRMLMDGLFLGLSPSDGNMSYTYFIEVIVVIVGVVAVYSLFRKMILGDKK